MFRHQGKTRTFKHNMRIASLLSFVAGIVNVTGFLSVQRLTTNVTGHFAFFVDEVFKMDIWMGFIFFLYIFSFFFGSFISGFLVEWVSRKNDHRIYIFPTAIESGVLLALAIFGSWLVVEGPNVFACILLFAMGLQNSLVTKISNATVRTTHLTGLFTDLGIELSQMFFYREAEQQKKLLASIKLRFTIISFFFIGGITGGIAYTGIGMPVLAIAGLTLLTGLIYDYVKLKVLLTRRSLTRKVYTKQRDL